MAETAGCLGKALMPARVVKAEVKVAKSLENGKGIRDGKGGVFKCDPSVSSVASASARKVGMNGKDATQVKCSVCGRHGHNTKNCWNVLRKSPHTMAALAKALDQEAVRQYEAHIKHRVCFRESDGDQKESIIKQE